MTKSRQEELIEILGHSNWFGEGAEITTVSYDSPPIKDITKEVNDLNKTKEIVAPVD